MKKSLTTALVLLASLCVRAETAPRYHCDFKFISEPYREAHVAFEVSEPYTDTSGGSSVAYLRYKAMVVESSDPKTPSGYPHHYYQLNVSETGMSIKYLERVFAKSNPSVIESYSELGQAWMPRSSPVSRETRRLGFAVPLVESGKFGLLTCDPQ